MNEHDYIEQLNNIKRERDENIKAINEVANSSMEELHRQFVVENSPFKVGQVVEDAAMRFAIFAIHAKITEMTGKPMVNFRYSGWVLDGKTCKEWSSIWHGNHLELSDNQEYLEPAQDSDHPDYHLAQKLSQKDGRKN